MQLPRTDPETLLAKLLPDLPPETVHMARACQALVRAKKVQTPAPLWRVVFAMGAWTPPDVRGPAPGRPGLRP